MSTQVDERILKGLRLRSSQASPAFMLGVAGAASAGACEPLDVRWHAHYHLAPSAGEGVVLRWQCPLVMAGVKVDAAGVPLASHGTQLGSSVMAFSGAGAITLTSRRLIGFLLNGESVFGRFDGGDSKVLVLTMPLAEVVAVTLDCRGRGREAGERGLFVRSAAGSDLFFNVDVRVDERDGSRPRSQRDAMTRLLAAVAKAWIPGESLQDRALLEDALAGRWVADHNDLVACLVSRGGAARTPVVASPATAGAASHSSACTQCGGPTGPGERFCAACGSPTISAPPACKRCGAEVQPAWAYCGTCGAALTAGATGCPT